MFKVIRDFCQAPVFMIMCDRSCGTYVSAGFQPGPNEDGQQAMWARQLIDQGWKISLSEAVCPGHVKQDAEGKSLIVLPNMQAAARRN